MATPVLIGILIKRLTYYFSMKLSEKSQEQLIEIIMRKDDVERRLRKHIFLLTQKVTTLNAKLMTLKKQNDLTH